MENIPLINLTILKVLLNRKKNPHMLNMVLIISELKVRNM